MPSKNKGEAPRRVVVAGKSPDCFRVAWRDPNDEGRLVPAPRSKLVTRDDTDVTAALKAWLEVWSYYELWDRSRTARRFAKDARLVGPEKAAKVGIDAARLTRLTQEAKHCAQRRDAFDEALKETANKFGPLGVGGTEIHEIIRALTDLMIIMVMFDKEVEPAAKGEIPISQQPLRRWKAAVDSSRFAAGTWTCLDLYSALVIRVCTIGDLRYGACEVCNVLFVRQRSDAKTCGERCRSLLRSEKQRRKRA
jgi:hypothetical protein